MESNQSPNGNFYAFIRHGERADQVMSNNEQPQNYIFPPQQGNPIDPPLTVVGMNQAAKTGSFLATFFQQNNL